MNNQQIKVQALRRAISALEDYRDQGIIDTFYKERELPETDIHKIEKQFQSLIRELEKRLTTALDKL